MEQRLKLYIESPGPIVDLLEILKDDPSQYIRRSVANNLNNIAKDHPQLVIGRCLQWQKGTGADREWIIRHATRTLVKQCYPGIYRLLGFTEEPKVFKLKNTILDGQEKLMLTKQHSFRPVTTRKYYSGQHAIEILISGKAITKKSFDLQLHPHS